MYTYTCTHAYTNTHIHTFADILPLLLGGVGEHLNSTTAVIRAIGQIVAECVVTKLNEHGEQLKFEVSLVFLLSDCEPSTASTAVWSYLRVFCACSILPPAIPLVRISHVRVMKEYKS